MEKAVPKKSPKGKKKRKFLPVSISNCTHQQYVQVKFTQVANRKAKSEEEL